MNKVKSFVNLYFCILYLFTANVSGESLGEFNLKTKKIAIMLLSQSSKIHQLTPLKLINKW